jgi:hypothetical protein
LFSIAGWRDRGDKGEPPLPPPRELADNVIVRVDRIEMHLPGV